MGNHERKKVKRIKNLRSQEKTKVFLNRVYRDQISKLKLNVTFIKFFISLFRNRECGAFDFSKYSIGLAKNIKKKWSRA